MAQGRCQLLMMCVNITTSIRVISGLWKQRQAAHILIAVAATAPQAEQDAAKAKAEHLLQQVKQNPAKFGELAKQNSQDPGSAANGGDLGFFGRGMMVKPFEDAAFALKQGEISGSGQIRFRLSHHQADCRSSRPGFAVR